MTKTSISALTPEAVERLKNAKQQYSFFHWEVGDCVIEAWARLKKAESMISKEVLVAHVSEIIERAPSRIHKIVAVVTVFASVRERFPMLSFGYFERALDFETQAHEEGLKFLEFADEQRADPIGKRSIEGCVWLFRSQILGIAVDNEYIVEYQPDEPAASLDLREEAYTPATSAGDDKERLYTILEGLIAPLRSLGAEEHTSGAKVLAGINLILEGLRDMQKEDAFMV